MSSKDKARHQIFLAVASVVLSASGAGSAHAQALSVNWVLTPIGDTSASGQLDTSRSMAYDPLTDHMILGETDDPTSSALGRMRVFDASDGATNTFAGRYLYDLPAPAGTPVASGWLAAAVTSSGKVVAWNNSLGQAVVWSSDSSSATFAQSSWSGLSPRNFTTSGETILSTGSADGGPITINDPDVSGIYALTSSFGNTNGPYGGRIGATFTPDKLHAWGTDTSGGTGPVGARNGIHQWMFSNGNWQQLPGNFQGNVFGTTNSSAATDVAVDQTQNLLFGENCSANHITMWDLGDANVAGDEVILGEVDAQADCVTSYGSLEIDAAHSHLYFNHRNTTLSGPSGSSTFGKMTYAAPKGFAGTSGGNWSDAGKWSSGGVPNGQDVAARLYPTSGAAAVNVNIPVTLQSLTLYSPNSYSLSGNTITLAVSEPTSPESAAIFDRINVIAGNHSITNNIIVANTTNAIIAANTLDITIPLANSGLTISGNISQASGTVGVQMDGYGTLTLSGSNTFSGTFKFNGVTDSTSASTTGIKQGGAVIITADNQLGDGSGTNTLSFIGGTLRTAASLSDSRNILLSAPSSTPIGVEPDLASAYIDVPLGITTTLDGAISGASGKLNKTGSGMLVLHGSNTYGGKTILSGGTVSISNPANLGAAVSMQFNGGTLQLNAPMSLSQSAALLGPGGVIDTQTNSITLTGAITNGSVTAGSLTKVGAGTLQFTNAGNIYSGPTTINAGTLQAGAANAFSPNSAYTVAAGATLDLNGLDQTVASLAGGGTALVSANVSVGADGINTTFASALSGTGGLIKNGAGTFSVQSLRLDHLTINNGIVHVSAAGRSGDATSILSSAPLIAANAQLDIEDNALIINYDASDTTHSTRDAIRNLLKTGRNGGAGQPGAWNGTGGIISSFANANGNGFNLAIGYGDNEDIALVRGSGSYTAFGGQTVNSNTVLVEMTRGADATLDGVVDAQDVTVLGSHFNKPNSGQWCFGDFDYSGTCDATDVTTLGSTFGKTSPALSPAQMTAEFGSAFTQAFEVGTSGPGTLPEPASLTLTGLGSLALLGRRKHRQIKR